MTEVLPPGQVKVRGKTSATEVRTVATVLDGNCVMSINGKEVTVTKFDSIAVTVKSEVNLDGRLFRFVSWLAGVPWTVDMKMEIE